MYNKREEIYNDVDLVTINSPHSIISEEFRTLRTNIQFSMFDRSFKTILITSSVSSEGKSTIAANLAVIFSTQGKKVLLVDADLRRPSLHRKFGLPNNRGLTSFLIGSEPSLSLILDKPYKENLHVLTSGLVPPNPSELLASQRMTDFIETTKEHFDIIIFDAPPVIAVTDAQILASKIDGTVFVVRNGLAERHKLIKAKEQLKKVNANVIGTVFNEKKKIKSNDYGYYRTNE
ncbi:CpsD/CapB family tyrosine-protein kinase [Alkalibacterium sp. 20]|uniref:CpsD/CapB family tyrosine-protein kinase n=1 Tax=Alkalibacterium sp. 20 TaxID=1798803 RepID=UPI00091330C0|nr:CpsD/CapB family tyrosine-protein kinase [Alkalibacterium sp. 20]OJF94201.1 exopolysaccharide biosynthesis protein [Alkalibacterium sp. 20]